MKRGIFLSIILSLFLVACIPQAMAQKQSRLEKLLRYLNDNDADKWQKNRDIALIAKIIAVRVFIVYFIIVLSEKRFDIV